MKIYIFFFTGTFVHFTGGNFHFFHAHHVLFSRERFGKKFHGDFYVFTGSFQENFTGRVTFSRPEIQKFSREENFFSRGKKKTLGLGSTRVGDHLGSPGVVDFFLLFFLK